MSPWPKVPLAEIAASVDYGLTAAATFEPAGPKFLRITDIQNGVVDWKRVPWCQCDGKSVEDSRLKTGDIVFARTGATTGKSFLLRRCPVDAVFASYLIRVRLKPNADPVYLSRFFDTSDYWAQIAKRARGVAQPGVNATNLKALQVPLPSLPEQRRIAAILDKADELRTKRRAALEELNQLTQGMFLEMFGDPAANPKRWPMVRTGDVADVQGGLQLSAVRRTYTREVPYLRVANVHRGFLDLREIKTLRATDAEIARTSLSKNDLLIVEGHGNPEEIGRGALWDASIAGCVHQNHLIRVRFDHKTVEPRYASEYLNSRGGRRHLLRAGKTTSGLNTISVSEVRAAPLALPPVLLQREFVRLLDAKEKIKAANRASLDEFASLFAVLESRAFRGEL